MRVFIALILGKLIFTLTRLTKQGGGSAAPGYYALKIAPNLVDTLSKTLKQQVIITGTNGKTTTSHFLSLFAKEQGLSVINNRTGSNLERGITSTLIQQMSFLDTLRARAPQVDLAIWETDEAAFNHLAPKLKPNFIVFLNVYRDQLDRYGEVDSTVTKWRETLSKLPKTTQILINNDDHNLLELTTLNKCEVITFASENKISGEKILSKIKTTPSDFQVKNIKSLGLEGTNFDLISKEETLTNIHISLPGNYQLYNFLAAFVLGIKLKLNPQKMINSLPNFSPAFGRVEQINIPAKVGIKKGYIFLIKNPTGATQVLETISSELTEKDSLFLALNDNFADGRDVSWIWDTNFEKLDALSSRSADWLSGDLSRNEIASPRHSRDRNDISITVSGIRAFDLANRLKYAGINQKKIRVEQNLETAFDMVVNENSGRIFFLITYTALLELQRILTKKGIKKSYWEGQ